MLSETELAARGISFSTVIPGSQISNAENYKVAGSSIVSGVVDAENPDILFRIGLQKPLSGYHEVNNPARYAVVLISYGTPVKVQKLFIRQGEGADNFNGVRWSPYNVRENRNFVNFPTQAGFFYQWGYSTTGTTPISYSPIGAVSDWPWNTRETLFSLDKASPANYTVPSRDQANILLGVNKNSFYGYYADGFFDRRMIVDGSGISYGEEVCVSNLTDDVAYIGKLFFSPGTNATLFLPSAGYRSSTNGLVTATGKDGCYLTSTPYGDDQAYFINTWDTGMLVVRWIRSHGLFSLRSVRQ
jgi:hypothetical protein